MEKDEQLSEFLAFERRGQSLLQVFAITNLSDLQTERSATPLAKDLSQIPKKSREESLLIK